MQMWFFSIDARDRADRWDEPTHNRMNDQLEFYTELMRKFNADMEKYLREELGCRQLINAGNWKSVDPVLCDDAERYSYTATEIVIANPSLRKATALDVNGLSMDVEVATQRHGERLHVTLPPNTLYTILSGD